RGAGGAPCPWCRSWWKAARDGAFRERKCCPHNVTGEGFAGKPGALASPPRVADTRIPRSRGFPYLLRMRFLHLADVHLDTSFSGRSDAVRRRLREASLDAFRRAVDVALVEEV